MTELIINIAPEKRQLVKRLITELGGSVVEKKLHKPRRKTPASEATNSTATNVKPAPTFLFGQWKNFDLDATQLRDETWGRKF